MNRQIIAAFGLVLLLSSCANSASHEVVSVSSPNDAYLSCDDILVAKAYMHLITAGVDKDKNDITQADMVDNAIWFPLNVIAKHNNYSSSTKTAELRLARLTGLEHEKGCDKPVAKAKPKAKAKKKSKTKSKAKTKARPKTKS